MFLAAVALAGCADKPGQKQPENALDGRWFGHFESSLGPLGCPGRGPLTVEIEKGSLAGDAQGDGFVMAVSGFLGSDGAVQDGVFRRDDRAAAIVTGTFLGTARQAAGRARPAKAFGRCAAFLRGRRFLGDESKANLIRYGTSFPYRLLSSSA
ncbi:MAG: hypothetical protein GKS00_21640 [Alphaproteobacteria bacterium]|nr:hypothetical protein [Alphaproteobacteria bacterium]